MEYVPTPASWLKGQLIGSFLSTADTSGPELTRDGETGWRASGLTGWRTLDPCGDGVDEVEQASGGNPSGMPFWVEAFDQCSTMGSRDGHDARADALLDRITSAALAREFWTGALRDDAGWDVGPRLAGNDDVTVVTTAAVSPAKAVQLLAGPAAEALLGPVVFHMTIGAFYGFSTGPALSASGNLITTLRGDLVVADAGYPGTGPDGQAPAAGEAWIYATARPVVHLGRKEDVQQDVDRSNNTITARASRLALITAVPGVWAAQITL